MRKQNVTAIFDIGKTNKKLLLFDEQYKLIYEQSQTFEEIKDEDGFPCEDINTLTSWVQQTFAEILLRKDIEVKAINFSAYGASFVHLDKNLKLLTPLYNYLKPYPEKLKQQFYNTYGGESLIAKKTASPVLGSLNSGLQLYRLKYEKPEIYQQIKYSLHLPQYLSFIISSIPASDITSVGCHTHLWDFKKNNYHDCVYREEIHKKFPAVFRADKTIIIEREGHTIAAGIGLHDSSAALIPYLKLYAEPFVLLSTGTWCISLNPFNYSMLTDHELNNDCLCYLSYEGNPVKASRLFAGYEHEEQVKELADHFNKDVHYYKTIFYDNSMLKKLQQLNIAKTINRDISMVQKSAFEKRALKDFESYEEAYHHLMFDIMSQQVHSTKFVLSNSPVQKIFVDGGFGKNDVYMHLLAAAFPGIKVYAANIPQASSLGAALVLHDHLYQTDFPPNLLELKYYSTERRE